jgi:hypothetical protein
MLHEMIWRVRDERALQRELELQCARAGRPATDAKVWFDYVVRQMQLHPLEWPSSGRPPSEHTCRIGAVFVDYRLIPDSQTVEVLRVHGKDAHSDSL